MTYRHLYSVTRPPPPWGKIKKPDENPGGADTHLCCRAVASLLVRTRGLQGLLTDKVALETPFPRFYIKQFILSQLFLLFLQSHKTQATANAWHHQPCFLSWGRAVVSEITSSQPPLKHSLKMLFLCFSWNFILIH